jgi:hypothetical protein
MAGITDMAISRPGNLPIQATNGLVRKRLFGRSEAKSRDGVIQVIQDQVLTNVTFGTRL